MNAVLDAVKQVPGVRDANVRSNLAGGHNLRLELADGADAAQVSRKVAQLLQEQMGLAASPREASPPTSPATPTRDGARERRRPVQCPSQPESARGRAHVEASAATPGRLLTSRQPGPRVLIDQVQVSTYGLDATVEVRLTAGPRRASGLSSGPSIDGYLLRLAGDAAVKAINQLLRAEVGVSEPRGQCYLEHAAVTPAGSCDIAVVVVYLACGGWVEQLAGAAVVADDARQAVVRAVLDAMNRRLEALLS